MVTGYHKNIENCLFELGNRWKEQRKIRQVKRGCEYPLSIVDPRTKRVVNYQPDLYFILRNNKKLIFEILDSEGDKQDIIIADVIRSFLIENVDGLIFIHPGPDDTEMRIIEAIITIYKGLTRKGIKESELPSLKKTGPYMVTREEARTTQTIEDKLVLYAESDKWFRSR